MLTNDARVQTTIMGALSAQKLTHLHSSQLLQLSNQRIHPSRNVCMCVYVCVHSIKDQAEEREGGGGGGGGGGKEGRREGWRRGGRREGGREGGRPLPAVPLL